MLEALPPSPISRIDHDGYGRCDVGSVLGVGIIVSREEQPIAGVIGHSHSQRAPDQRPHSRP
jgi:hypothetical protein